MALFLSMLPVYLVGNLHCIGMCGPLVMMIGQHKFRYFYFLGRLCSFSLAGLIAGQIGAVIGAVLKAFHLPELMSFFFGFLILGLGVITLLGIHYPGYQTLAKILDPFNKRLSLLMLQDKAWPSFGFGFLTIVLPCGQTLIVFSACALAGNASTGLFNGFAFALLTSPALWMAMNVHSLLKQAKLYYQQALGWTAIFAGTLAICRSFAEAELIPHFVLSKTYHMVIF